MFFFGRLPLSSYICGVLPTDGMMLFNTQMKKEFGKWFLDLAKYILTAIALTTLFRGMEETRFCGRRLRLFQFVYYLAICFLDNPIWIRNKQIIRQ